jgi:hypothetical protein
MIDAEKIFNNQYLALYLIATSFVIFCLIEDNFKNIKHYRIKSFFVLGFGFLFLILFGFRDLNVGVDTQIYTLGFESRKAVFKDFGFKYFTLFFKEITDTRGFLLIIAITYIAVFLAFMRNWNKEILAYIFFMYISLFFFKNMGMNVVRQGISCVVFLLAISVHKNSKSLLSLVLFIISFSFQASIIIPIAVWFGSKFISLKAAITFLIICSGLSIIGFGLNKLTGLLPLLSNIFDDRFNSYLDGTGGKDYIIGFRANFFAFNWFFVIIGLWINKKIYTDELQDKILRVFIILSGIFFLYFTIPFSDRIGLLSWIFIPLIFAPLFSNLQISAKYRIGTFGLFFVIFLIFVIFPSK